MFYKTESLALFIDGASTFSAARANNLQIDYAKMLDAFSQRGRLLRAYYYSPLDESGDFAPLKKLTDYLSYNGFMVTTRDITDRDSGFRKANSYLHVQMTVDALAMAPALDHAVIMSGDGNLAPLVLELKRRGMRVSVCSSHQSPEGSFVADELRRHADQFIEIAALRDLIALERQAT